MEKEKESSVPRRFLTKKQAAEYLQISVRTLENHVRNGELPACRLGRRTIRFDLEAIVRCMMEKQKN
jgi:excisionase family DNA binding protein